jgi:hypothetical protein
MDRKSGSGSGIFHSEHIDQFYLRWADKQFFRPPHQCGGDWSGKMFLALGVGGKCIENA